MEQTDTLLALSSEEDKRWKNNCTYFSISFLFLGIVQGVLGDTFVTFLSLKSPNVAKALSSYLGIAIFICALLSLLVHKIGYKKILIPAPIVLILSFIGIMYIKNDYFLPLFATLADVGYTIASIILPLVLSSYTLKKDRTQIFSRALYFNIGGTALATLFDGNLVVWIFSKKIGINYLNANLLTKRPNLLNHFEMSNYLASYRLVLWFTCIVAAISCLFLFFLKEKSNDFRELNIQEENKKATKISFKKKYIEIFENRHIVAWLFFTLFIAFGASLIVPYFPIYLNQILHISRGTISVMLSAQYLAMVVFIMLTPVIEKKFGSITSLTGLFFLSIPLMLIIANGQIFGNSIVLIIGVTLFVRSGFANACQPIQQALPMSFVTKDVRPTYNAVINIVQSLSYTIGGLFVRYFLFSTPQGYAYAYYLTGILYIIANISVLTVFYKKYNRYIEENSINVKHAHSHNSYVLL